ncbi:MAG: c-type cytochrome [Verrucomicrobiaceae bacterium]|nr:c-type cytochrome [Verrucomicrobiaceae bacterium]
MRSPCSFVLAVASLMLGAQIRAEEKTLMSKPDSGAVTGKLPAVPPTPATEAAKTFKVLDGFRMDLLAAEPLVASPVAMTYDENGRAYVCEMRDYPYTDKANHKPSQENPTDKPIGRVRLLEDTNDDGVFDKATVFAEDLSWPTGVACWKGGVYVAATPDVWYLKDTDGDGKADVREKVFSGFKKLNVQAVMNNLVWGLDNRIHGAGGSNGGKITPGDITLSRADFHFDATTRAFELESGGARFGGSYDDWGNRFLCNIRNPAQHIVLPAKYLARNKSLAARSPLNDMAESGDQLPVYRISPPEPWREIRAKRWAGERDINMPRSELIGAGVVTSASGVTSYRGTAYPENYRGNVFVTECAGNLLYRLQLTPDGVTFKAERVDGQQEMVASTDNWFRPVNFVNAPDGTLHIMDMYRENIEHPWSIPEDIHAAVDLEAGRDMGRLWRLTPPDFKPVKTPRLGSASSAELVVTLENPNSWWRETAQRLLFERQDKSVVASLQTMVRQGKLPQARLHALWTLEGLGALANDDLLVALKDSAAGVREHAVKLAEPRALTDAILPLARDADARVRFQVAFTLGELNDQRALDALAYIAKRDADDPWIRAAVLSSVQNDGDELLARLLADKDFAGEPTSIDLISELAQIIGARGKSEEMQRVFEQATDIASLCEVSLGVGEGLKRGGKSLRGAGLTAAAKNKVERLLAAAANVATDSTQPVASRESSIRLLSFDNFSAVKETFVRLMDGKELQDIQVAAIKALGSFTTPEAVPPLLANWRTQTPAVRSEVIAAMMGVRTRALPLLQAVESGLIPANQIPFAQRRLLSLNADPTVKALAEKFFSASAPRPRKQVIEKYQPALSMKGDAVRGQKVFEAACIACHRAGDVGKQDVGPNLANIRAWNPEQVLINILDPNREVVPNFLAYTVETTEGKSIYGLIAEESTTSLTMKRPDGVSETVLRSSVAKLEGAGVSLMPDGLEAAISPEQMADLIVFLLAPGGSSR